MTVHQAVAAGLGRPGLDGDGSMFTDETRAWRGHPRHRPAGVPRLEWEGRDGRLWVILLAGGEGRRLLDWTRGPDGVPVPKQFYRFRDERTLLRVTLDRARSLVPPEQVVCVMLEQHRPWWEPELSELPAANVLSQPEARGTAVAILHALEHIRLHDAAARVLLLPSDHDVEDEGVLATTLGSASRTAGCFPDELLLLGARPTDADTDYGLVLPRAHDHDPVPRVRAFVEKPARDVGESLMRRGARWNTFMFTCSARVLLALYANTLPALLAAYRRRFAQARDGGHALRRLFAHLPTHDFSRDLLQRAPARLRLATIPECGWTDLGTPARLETWLGRHRDARYHADRMAEGTPAPFERGETDPRG